MKLFRRDIANISFIAVIRHLFSKCRKHFVGATAAVGLACLTMTASAAVISYNPTPVGGTQWRFDYGVSAEIGGSPIYEFTIFFDPAMYSNLVVLAAPAGWDALAIEPDPGIPADGFFDALALGAGIDPGNSLTGFSVSFDFLGAGSPGSQRFEIVDPDTFVTIDAGMTVALNDPSPGQIPEPGGFALFGLAFALLTASRRGS